MTRLSPSFLRYFIYNNAFISAMDTLATGTLLTAYALALGASPLVVGCLGGLPYVGTLVNILGALLVYRGYNVKKVTVAFSFASRPFYLVCAALALFPGIPNKAGWLLVAVTLCYLVGGVSAGAYYPWLKAVLPEKQTHLFVERKYTASMLAHIFAFLAAFFLMHYWSDAQGNPPFAAYGIIFIVAFLCGIIGTGYLVYIPSANPPLQHMIPAKKQILQVFSRYRYLLSVYSIGLGILLFTGTFIPVFALQVGHISVTLITALALIGEILFLISLPYWKRLNEKKHSLYSTQVSFLTLGLFLTCLIGVLPFMQTNALFYAAGALFIISFIFRAGIQTGLDATLLLQAPQEISAIFFAVFSWLKLTTALGPILAGLCWTVLKQWGDLQTIGCWQIFFIICILGCLLTAGICAIYRKSYE